MRYVNQLEYPHIPYITKVTMNEEAREHGKTTTIQTSGCGLCSAIMVADRLLPNCGFDLKDAIAYVGGDRKGYTGQSTIM